MSLSKNENICLKRLAKQFAAGTTATSVKALFDGLQLDDGQKHAICESLKARGTIKPVYQLGQRLPYQIEIHAAVITERDNTINDNKFERLKSNLLSSWWFGIPTFVFVVVAAIIGFLVLVLSFYGISPNQ